MKKIFTSILLLLPFLTFAQTEGTGPWNFNASGNFQGWTASQGSTPAAGSTAQLSANGTDLIYTTVAGATAVSRNPFFYNSTANINASTYNELTIRLKNGTAATFLRVTVSGTATFFTSVITANDADYKIYKIPITTTGTITNVTLEFKTDNASSTGANYVPASAGLPINIDYIIPSVAVIPTQNTFTFNATTEGFTVLTRATAVQATESTFGTLRMTATTANAQDARVGLASSFAKVDGTTNKYAHITLKNTSTNTRFAITGTQATTLPIQTVTTNDATYKIYDFDLTTWTGNQQPELVFGVQTTWLATSTYAVNQDVIFQNSTYRNLTGTNSTSPANPKTDPTNWAIQGTEGALLDLVNSIYIDNIVFDNVAPVLSIRDIFSPITGGKKKVTTISLYPNPTQETLNIEAKFSVEKIEIYNLTGQKVLQNQKSDKINIVSLNNGVYFVKVTQKYGDPEFLKFVKD